MKTLNIQDLLEHYKVNVKYISLDDILELEDMFHTREEIIKRLYTLNLR